MQTNLIVNNYASYFFSLTFKAYIILILRSEQTYFYVLFVNVKLRLELFYENFHSKTNISIILYTLCVNVKQVLLYIDQLLIGIIR